MYIFLDIDGVLVKLAKTDEPTIVDISSPETDNKEFDYSCLQKFETLIRQYPATKIVISSTWREIFSLEEIKRRFSNDVAEKVIGVTPILASYPQEYARYAEVLNYLEQHNLSNEAWIAIDDFAEHYPPTIPIIVTHPHHGFDAHSAKKLAGLLDAHQTLRTELHQILDSLPDQKLPIVQLLFSYIEANDLATLEEWISPQ